jgi:hypothetical protein
MHNIKHCSIYGTVPIETQLIVRSFLKSFFQKQYQRVITVMGIKEGATIATLLDFIVEEGMRNRKKDS